MADAPDSPLTHAFLDARLEAVETRMDARIERMAHKMDVFLESMQAVRTDIRELRGEIKDVRTEIADVRSETARLFAGMRRSIVLTAIPSVLAIVFGVAAFNATVLGNMLAAFASGGKSAQVMARLEVQQALHNQQLERLSQRLAQ